MHNTFNISAYLPYYKPMYSKSQFILLYLTKLTLQLSAVEDKVN